MKLNIARSHVATRFASSRSDLADGPLSQVDDLDELVAAVRREFEVDGSLKPVVEVKANHVVRLCRASRDAFPWQDTPGDNPTVLALGSARAP